MAPPFGIRLEDADMQVQEIAADVAQLLRTTTFLNMSDRDRPRLLAAFEDMHTEALRTRLLKLRRVFQLAMITFPSCFQQHNQGAPRMLRNIFKDSASYIKLTDTLRELTEMCLIAQYEPLNVDMKLRRCVAMPHASAPDAEMCTSAHASLTYCSALTHATTTRRVRGADINGNSLDPDPSPSRNIHRFV